MRKPNKSRKDTCQYSSTIKNVMSDDKVYKCIKK